jgi:uncharacterized repeat protein (TIGR03833 family)
MIVCSMNIRRLKLIHRFVLSKFLMNGTKRADIRVGSHVKIVLKKDQRSGALTEGTVSDILTSSPTHHRGIKVRLDDGQVGRVKEILTF